MLDEWPNSPDVNTTAIRIASVYDDSKYGIARYVLEEADYFVTKGFRVVKIGITPDKNSDVSFDLRSISGLIKWIRYCSKGTSDAISFHYYDGLTFPYIGQKFPPIRWLTRIMQGVALCLLARSSPTSRLVLHEIIFSDDVSVGKKYITGYAMSLFGNIEVFTDVVATRLVQNYPFVKESQIMIVDHDRYMLGLKEITRGDAREILGLNNSKMIFLCIGFWAPQKGFLEAMKIFGITKPDNSELWIVGQINGDNQMALDYENKITGCSELYNSVHICNEYVSDEKFDLWLRAADYVFLPYISGMNSGVGARTRTIGTGVIISNLPTLRSQFPDARHYENEEQLIEIIRSVSKNQKSEK